MYKYIHVCIYMYSVIHTCIHTCIYMYMYSTTLLCECMCVLLSSFRGDMFVLSYLHIAMSLVSVLEEEVSVCIHGVQLEEEEEEEGQLLCPNMVTSLLINT